jgi:type II secretory pathway pseudopilin PulG
MLITLRGKRAGISLVEVIVALALLLIMTVAVMPSLAGTRDRDRVLAAAAELDEIMFAMGNMRSDNQDWPGRISHLSYPITTSDVNVCGGTYPNGKVNNWDGPYLARVVPPTGLELGIGVAQDSLVRQVLTGQHALMLLEIDGVSEEDAIELNRLLDADGSATGGAIRWTITDAASGMARVQLARPIKGC